MTHILRYLFILLILFLLGFIIVSVLKRNSENKYLNLGHAGTPKYDINNCEAATGVVSMGDYYDSNQRLCWNERARKLNDLNACYKLVREFGAIGMCVANISLNVGVYHCDDIEDSTEKDQCNKYLIEQWSDKEGKFHNLIGIERHRIENQITLKNGDKFLSNPVTVTNEGITYFSNNTGSGYFTCLGEQNNFKQSVGYQAGIYITDCSVVGGIGTIKYFTYDFPFFKIPEGL